MGAFSVVWPQETEPSCSPRGRTQKTHHSDASDLTVHRLFLKVPSGLAFILDFTGSGTGCLEMWAETG